MGAIPFKTLGLTNDYMFDGWDNKIFYATQTAFVNNDITNSSCGIASAAANSNILAANACFRAQASTGGSISLDLNVSYNDYYGGIYNLPYLMLSAGPNGAGAYRSTSDGAGPNTDRNPDPSYPPHWTEPANLDGDTQFPLEGTTFDGATFDDIIYFSTRNQLVMECNKQHKLACTINWGIDFR
jgi:hypothetical protein